MAVSVGSEKDEPTKSIADNLQDLPLVVDLDGTLILSDTTFELCLLHFKRHPFIGLFQIFFWFLRGRSDAKQRLFDIYSSQISVSDLPYSQLRELNLAESATEVALVSGSHHAIVEEVADYVGGFGLAQGSIAGRNLTGAVKAEFLVEKYPQGFAYIGNSHADVAVWQAAARPLGFNVSNKVVRTALNSGIDLEVLSVKKSQWRSVLKGMRLHQWSKNALLAVIPFMNLTAFQPVWVLLFALSFVAFGLIASATYLINDLLDLQADRAHPAKKTRPFAAGAISVPTGLGLIAAMYGAGLLIALGLGVEFTGMLISYSLISMAYSFYLKRIVILDALVLSLLFCWRILSGGFLLDIYVDTWFMLAVGFFFFSLALGKRAIELHESREQARNGQIILGRGYVAADFMVVFCAGIASGFMAVVVVLIYALLSKSDIIERETSAVLIIAILVFWQTRFWLLVGRNQVHDDPVVFALKDRLSLTTLSCLSAVIVFEQFWPKGGM